MRYNIGIVDDHLLFARSIALMLDSFIHFQVTLEVNSGTALQQALALMPQVPDIILLDVNMPGMDGAACAMWLTSNYPGVKLAALTMNDTESAVVKMVRAGCASYLLKNTHPNEFEKALLEIAETGSCNAGSHFNFKRIIHTADHELTGEEQRFLEFACSDFTYEHIAQLMQVSKRTVEHHRASVFEKLNVQNRTSMAIEAIRRGLVKI